MRNFFTYEDRLPENVGWTVFGPVHLATLAALLLLTMVLLCVFRHLEEKEQEKREKRVVLFLVGSEAVRLSVLLAMGVKLLYELPLHLCGLAGFLCLYDAYTNRIWSGQTLYCLCLPGTLSALLFPDWSAYPWFSFISLLGFLYHAGIVLYVGMRLLRGKLVPDIRKMYQTLLFLLVTVPPIYLFDKCFSANYFFVNVPSPGSPLMWMADRMGVPGYLLGYAALVIAVMTFMYLLDFLVRRLAGRPLKHR
jgi:hypothetical integral membrane protein (TIGR02206 family)